VKVEDVGEALDAVLGGVAADPFVVDAIVIVKVIEVGLEVVGIALAGVGAEAGGEGVAETDEEGERGFGGGGG
jgi:hypothetical protein